MWSNTRIKTAPFTDTLKSVAEAGEKAEQTISRGDEAIALAGIARFFESPDLSALDAGLPDIALPDIALPDAALPDTALPDIALPDIALPDTIMEDAVPSPAAAKLRDESMAHAPSFTAPSPTTTTLEDAARGRAWMESFGQMARAQQRVHAVEAGNAPPAASNRPVTISTRTQNAAHGRARMDSFGRM
jgi:hypothetical protein